MKHKAMLIYPPTHKIYQRGEDRSQGNVTDSTATTMRACNDLGYGAKNLENIGFEVFLRDYQTQKLSIENLKCDFLEFVPNILFVSTTNGTIFDDIETLHILFGDIEMIQKPIVILKGSIFYDADFKFLDTLDLSLVDFLIGGESDFILPRIAKKLIAKDNDFSDIHSIFYKHDKEWIKNKFYVWDDDLDSLPFPNRDKINNSLYVRPDTNEPMATIATSRGCSANCIYCLTPKISGKKIRLRSPKNIYEEILECYEKHNIKNFFFKSDTFTMNRMWVSELCEYILNSKLSGKISWVANSRVNPLEKKTLEIMKKAGCYLVAFGFESGSQETLKRIKKGARVEDNLAAARWSREVGLKTFGFFMIGFPWENYSHINDTKKLIFELDCDFLELHIFTPYYGTEGYDIAKQSNLIDGIVYGKDYFNAPSKGTEFISMQELSKIRKKIILSYHLRPSYIFKKLKDSILKPKVLINYFNFGYRLIYNNLK